MLTPLLLTAALALMPSTFFFGVSNAAFQVEGTPVDSDWRRWTHSTDPEGHPRIVDGSNAEVATNFWHRYDEEFALAQAGSMNAFRMSIAWERIIDAQGRIDTAALAHYEAMVVAMRARGLEPFITLQHFVLPGWVADKGGLLWADYPSHFATFAKVVVQRLAAAPANVRFFITINEPNIQVRGGYLDDHKFPPGFNDSQRAAQALAALAQAHVQAYNAIASLALSGVQVGLSQNWQVFLPRAPSSAGDVAGATFLRRVFNESLMDAITNGTFAVTLPGGGRVVRQMPLLNGRAALDFVGVQNYGRSFVRTNDTARGMLEENGDGPVSDLGWELVPGALYQAVKEISAYGLPVIITETGVADRDDKMRSRYLRDNFADIARLRAAGVPLFGYIHWTLTDNFEWALGKTARFGLVAVDNATGAYTPRGSLWEFKRCIDNFRRQSAAAMGG